MAEAYRQFSTLRKVAATRNVLLPVGHDHNVPSRFCTEIHREWNERYVWPRFVVGLPRDFFAAVRADASARSVTFSPQTRDMNPVYTGKDVSYIDTKQAQRAAEVSVLDGERMAALTTLLGARYPAEALDKAWRQLVYGAHHDAITGTESDQVYLDLLTGWREADELGLEVLTGAIDHLAAHADTTGAGEAVIVVNTLAFAQERAHHGDGAPARLARGPRRGPRRRGGRGGDGGRDPRRGRDARRAHADVPGAAAARDRLPGLPRGAGRDRSAAVDGTARCRRRERVVHRPGRSRPRRRVDERVRPQGRA